MLMALGQFIFSLQTAPYEEFKRSQQWRHPSHSRVGTRPARQFVGVGDEGITLSGAIAPEFAGKATSLAEIRRMADTGQAWPLVSGTGEVFGAFVIESMNETSSHHLPNGLARKIAFDLQLTRVDMDKGGVQVGVGSMGNFSAQ